MLQQSRRNANNDFFNNMKKIMNDFTEHAKVIPRMSRLDYARTIVIPNGPAAGEKYRPERQPVCDLILREFERDYWTVFLFMWSVQSGKSFTFVNLETCYIAEVLQEDQIIAVPDDSMVKSKWAEIRSILIEKGAGNLLPSVTGIGGKGGSKPSEVTFSNGARLRFMTAGTSDAGRSGFTARHVCVDEIDKQTKAQSTSKETTPVKQYEARQASYPMHRRRFRGTSTIAEETGYLWTTHQIDGSNGHVMVQCHCCGKWVFPERKHLLGWQNANTELEAMKSAYLVCPECDGKWNEEQRIAAVKKAVIIHKGQTIDEHGNVIGELPETTIGTVRATGIHDILGKSIAEIAAKEYRSRKLGNPEEMELDIDQFFFVIPKRSKEEESVPITIEDITKKNYAGTRRYRVPDNYVRFVIGVDMHSAWLQYVAVAELAPEPGTDENNYVVVDYGEMNSGAEIFDEKTGQRRLLTLEKDGKFAWFKMLDRFFDRCFSEGWESSDEKKVFPSRIYIDSRYNSPQSKATNDRYVLDQWQESIDFCRFLPNKTDSDKKVFRCKFCNQQTTDNPPPSERVCAIRTLPEHRHKDKIRLVMGMGSSERDNLKYNPKHGKEVINHGNGWHQVLDKQLHFRNYWIFDSDRSKLQVQNRFIRSDETPGTILLYRVDNQEDHHKYALSITSKRQITDEKGKIVWKQERNDDHALDATGIAFVGLEIEHFESINNTVDLEVINQLLTN